MPAITWTFLIEGGTSEKCHKQTSVDQFVPGWWCDPPARSPLLVWVKNVILCGHGFMADMPAIGAAPVGRERVGRRAIVEQGVSPSAAGRKSRVILFDEEKVFQSVRHIHGERGLCTLFRRPLDLSNLGPVGEFSAVARNAGLIRRDH